MVEVTEDDREIAAELAHALGMTAEEFTSGACDVLVQIAARHRQAGVQQGLDMAAAYLDGFKYNDIVMDGCTMRREWRKDFAAAIRNLGGDDA